MGKIRMATAADTKAILDIYAPYIEHTNITSTPALVLWKRRYFLAVPSSMANGLGLCGWKNLWWNGENHCLFRRYGM